MNDLDCISKIKEIILNYHRIEECICEGQYNEDFQEWDDYLLPFLIKIEILIEENGYVQTR